MIEKKNQRNRIQCGDAPVRKLASKNINKYIRMLSPSLPLLTPSTHSLHLIDSADPP